MYYFISDAGYTYFMSYYFYFISDRSFYLMQVYLWHVIGCLSQTFPCWYLAVVNTGHVKNQAVKSGQLCATCTKYQISTSQAQVMKCQITLTPDFNGCRCQSARNLTITNMKNFCSKQNSRAMNIRIRFCTSHH